MAIVEHLTTAWPVRARPRQRTGRLDARGDLGRRTV